MVTEAEIIVDLVNLCRCEECPLDRVKVLGEGMGAIRSIDGGG
jgi:hypothetical protein